MQTNNVPLPKVPGYDILRVVSTEGASAIVYWGIDKRSGFPVAVKRLLKSSAKSEFLLNRFRITSDIQLTLSSHHNRLVRMIDFVEYDGEYYLMMEFVEGADLDKYQRQKSGPIPEERAIPMFLKILDAIDYMHKARFPGNNQRRGVLHLDIKPNNIKVLENDEVKVLDLGLSAFIDDLRGRCVSLGGTPQFMPPEQADGGYMAPYTDIFALGTTLFFMLSARYAFELNTAYEHIKAGKIPRIKNYYPFVKPEIQDILDKAMNPDYTKRYQSCSEFTNDLVNLYNINLKSIL